MVKRFAWIVAFVLLAAPALGQTAIFRHNDDPIDRIQSDGGGAYVDGVDCSLVQTNSEGNFFMRTSWFYGGELCEGLSEGEGRSRKLIFEGDCSKFIDHPYLACGEKLFSRCHVQCWEHVCPTEGEEGYCPNGSTPYFLKDAAR